MSESKINSGEKDVPPREKAGEEAEGSFPYSDKTLGHMFSPRHLGMLPAPDSQAKFTGPCGDTVEVFLQIEDGVIRQAFFLADGCQHTIACGDAICELVLAKTYKQAFQINAEKLIEYLGGFPEDHVHCASLAVNTMRKALLEYIEIEAEPWKKAYRK